MTLRKQGRRIVRNLGDEIRDMAPGNLKGVSFSFGDTNGFAAIGTENGGVTVSRDWWRNAGRKDRRGLLIHELAHVAGVGGTTGGNWAGNKGEQTADAIRLSLNGRAGINEGTLPAARRIAKREGWLNMAVDGYAGNGPKTGDGNRKRNTFANILSKNKVNYTNPGGAAALPALSPGETANYYSQLQGLYAGYQAQLAQLKLQRVGAKAGLRESLAGVRAGKIAGLADTENAAIESGMLGSSADLQRRAGVRGEAAAAAAGAKNEARQTIAGTRLAGQQAGIDYFMGVQGLEAQKLASQQEALANQLQNNMIISGQESTTDMLKAIYQSFTQNQGGGGGGNGDDGNGGARKPSEFDFRKWIQQQADTSGLSLTDYVNKVFASKRGA